MIIQNDSTRINYVDQGSGVDTLLFIHGWCINSGYWQEQIGHFSNTHRVVAIDLPGFGKSTSTRSEWTVKNYAQDVISLIDELTLRNVVLIGHSMGGEIALEAALSNHASIKDVIGVDNFKMIGVPSTPEQLEEINAFLSALADDFTQVAPASADQMLFHPSTATEVKERVKKDIVETDPDIGLAVLVDLMNYAKTEPERLAESNYKLYLINSDATPTNTDGLQKYCKSSYQVFAIPATGHYPMVEKPKAFITLLETALKTIKGEDDGTR